MKIEKFLVSPGITYVQIPDAQLQVLCGCPADSVKHLMRRGLISEIERNGLTFETGPNAILLSDIVLQNGAVANFSEFPVLQMLYKQGMLIPGHPNNDGSKPLLMGSKPQVDSQLEYIYRGNYGLISHEEILETGTPADVADEIMRQKLAFAFGQIKSSDAFVDTLDIGTEPVAVKNGVTLRRTAVNVFEFTFEDETVTVDLNLPAGGSYLSPYPLGFQHTPREYFAVVHSGDGDGWDYNRPCMASILMYQGQIFLIDAGPNISSSLRALGIGMNEINGIFHTHSHDDHFAGLTDIIRSDHKVRYFAPPLVRKSVAKKLSALLSINEDRFEDFFDVHDLTFDEWNDVDGMEVMPILSPHPVETSLYVFRALWENGYKTYAHFADISSFKTLDNMVTDTPGAPGISKEYCQEVKDNYLQTTSLKKVDAGGGMIHGEAIDFVNDQTDKIIISHIARPLTNGEKEIGSGAQYGAVDVLIPSFQTFERRNGFRYLASYFPDVSHDRLNVLLNNPVKVFNPETILIREGRENDFVYLLLTGEAEMLSSSDESRATVVAGALFGEQMALHSVPSNETYRTRTFVQALTIPCSLYKKFILQNDLFGDFSDLQEIREFLRWTWLFGEGLSHAALNRVAKEAHLEVFAKGDTIENKANQVVSLGVVKAGSMKWTDCDGNGAKVFESGSFFGEESVLFGVGSGDKLEALEPTQVYLIPIEHIHDIPVVRWKLLETYKRNVGIVD